MTGRFWEICIHLSELSTCQCLKSFLMCSTVILAERVCSVLHRPVGLPASECEKCTVWPPNLRCSYLGETSPSCPVPRESDHSLLKGSWQNASSTAHLTFFKKIDIVMLNFYQRCILTWAAYFKSEIPNIFKWFRLKFPIHEIKVDITFSE